MLVSVNRHTPDPRTPVIIGAAQVTDRTDDPTIARTALELMVDALRSAAIDAGAADCPTGLDVVAVVGGLWRYTDPARQVADRVGADAARTLLTGFSGHTPQALLSHLADEIAAGRLEAAAVLGGEANRSRIRAKRLGVEPRRDHDLGLEAAERFGEELEMSSEHERERGVLAPTTVYPVFETALRYARGETIPEHRARLGELWAGFNTVAVDNPHAVDRTPRTAAQIAGTDDGNRMIGFPYTRCMNANNTVDQASAVLIVSAERAAALGVPRDRWVFLHAATTAYDPPLITERADLHSSPAVRVAGRRALEMAGVGIDDVAHLDLYSCFPSAVQISSAELGIAHDRPLTVTGGLTFAGAPLNNYSGQAIAAMVQRLRDDPGWGFVHANGGYVTKHAFGVYGTEPPAAGFLRQDCQAEAETQPPRTADPGFTGTATIEGYSVVHDRDGAPEHALVALRTPGDARVWGTTTDATVLHAMTVDEHVGRSGELDPDGLVAV